MRLVYLQFPGLPDLKAFSRHYSLRKIVVLLNQNVLLARFSRKEIEMAVKNFHAEVIRYQTASGSDPLLSSFGAS